MPCSQRSTCSYVVTRHGRACVPPPVAVPTGAELPAVPVAGPLLETPPVAQAASRVVVIAVAIPPRSFRACICGLNAEVVTALIAGSAPACRAATDGTELPADFELRATRRAVYGGDILTAVRAERDRPTGRQHFVT